MDGVDGILVGVFAACALTCIWQLNNGTYPLFHSHWSYRRSLHTLLLVSVLSRLVSLVALSQLGIKADNLRPGRMAHGDAVTETIEDDIAVMLLDGCPQLFFFSASTIVVMCLAQLRSVITGSRYNALRPLLAALNAMAYTALVVLVLTLPLATEGSSDDSRHHTYIVAFTAMFACIHLFAFTITFVFTTHILFDISRSAHPVDVQSRQSTKRPSHSMQSSSGPRSSLPTGSVRSTGTGSSGGASGGRGSRGVGARAWAMAALAMGMVLGNAIWSTIDLFVKKQTLYNHRSELYPARLLLSEALPTLAILAITGSLSLSPHGIGRQGWFQARLPVIPSHTLPFPFRVRRGSTQSGPGLLLAEQQMENAQMEEANYQEGGLSSAHRRLDVVSGLASSTL